MKKLDHKWAGPFTITKVISPAAIKLHLSTWEKNIHPVVSISSIHPYIPDEIVEHPQPLQSDPITVDDQEEYEVEEILDSRFRWGKLWYLVKFIGWSHSNNMWLPPAVEGFHLQHPNAPCTSSASTPPTSGNNVWSSLRLRKLRKLRKLPEAQGAIVMTGPPGHGKRSQVALTWAQLMCWPPSHWVMASSRVSWGVKVDILAEGSKFPQHENYIQFPKWDM